MTALANFGERKVKLVVLEFPLIKFHFEFHDGLVSQLKVNEEMSASLENVSNVYLGSSRLYIRSIGLQNEAL